MPTLGFAFCGSTRTAAIGAGRLAISSAWFADGVSNRKADQVKHLSSLLTSDDAASLCVFDPAARLPPCDLDKIANRQCTLVFITDCAAALTSSPLDSVPLPMIFLEWSSVVTSVHSPLSRTRILGDARPKHSQIKGRIQFRAFYAKKVVPSRRILRWQESRRWDAMIHYGCRGHHQPH